MTGIKTGIGGFEIDGKVYSYDVGDPNAPGDEKLPSPDPGDIKINNDKKDLSKGTKVTLSKYLKSVTENNSYPHDGDYKEGKITDEKGFPHSLSDSHENTNQFTDRPKTSGVTFGPEGDPATKLADLKKGKSSKPGKDGHVLLPGVKKDSLPEPIKTYTSSVLKNNRFSDAARSSAEISGLTNDAKPPADYNPKLKHPRYGEVSHKQLAQVGTALSLRASQELNAASKGNNPTSDGQELAALLPGGNQLGATKVNVTLLEARDIFESLTKDEIPDISITNIADTSWGALNNVDDPWSGILALGMIALSVALTAAITLLFEVLGVLFGLIKGSSGNPRNVSGRYVLGRYHVTKGADPSAFPPGLPPDIGALLGLKTTVFPFKKCVTKGSKIFFGIDDSSVGNTFLTSGLKSAAQTPGYNSIVARAIIRSGQTIIGAFKGLSSSNIVASIKNILSVIDAIRSSKLIAAANVFAMLGDAALTDPGDLIKASDAIPEEPIKKSRMDSISNGTAFSTVAKNRLNGSIKLAWASNRAPAMYLVPESILVMSTADSTLGGFKGNAAISDPGSKTKTRTITADEMKSAGARIPRSGESDPLTVQAFEQELDAEYVPFSFHDLRTNEIISFHAFLASLNDDYAANYETVDAYGRVDPVKIYKSTHRKVGMSFYVVATSEVDFNEMWVKLNKLTTMLYPQYTRGRMLVGENSEFVQPFSQLMAASPVIRIRLGDLFRSNYSRFALARLFGMGGADSIKLDGETLDPFTLDQGKGVEDANKKLATPQKGKKYYLTIDGWPQASGGALSIGVSLPIPGGGGDKPKQAPELQFDMQHTTYINAIPTSLDDDTQMATVEIKLMSAADIAKNHGYSPERANEIFKDLKQRYDNSDDPTNKITGSAKYQVPYSVLEPSVETRLATIKEATTAPQSSIEKMSEFLDPKKNALVRSFNNIQGKGLAGVIESMNFDWYDKVTWEIMPGSTAPKMCKITISFAPIHDISPGIDHMGYNRSPIYPVGAGMRHGKDPKSGTEK